jgi:hypothetical protein
MSSIINTLKKRHIEARSDRAMARVIAGAGSASMRDELIVISQRTNSGINR